MKPSWWKPRTRRAFLWFVMHTFPLSLANKNIQAHLLLQTFIAIADFCNKCTTIVHIFTNDYIWKGVWRLCYTMELGPRTFGGFLGASVTLIRLCMGCWRRGLKSHSACHCNEAAGWARSHKSSCIELAIRSSNSDATRHDQGELKVEDTTAMPCWNSHSEYRNSFSVIPPVCTASSVHLPNIALLDKSSSKCCIKCFGDQLDLHIRHTTARNTSATLQYVYVRPSINYCSWIESEVALNAQPSSDSSSVCVIDQSISSLWFDQPAYMQFPLMHGG